VSIIKCTYSEVPIRLLGLRCKILKWTEWRMGRLVDNKLIVVLMKVLIERIESIILYIHILDSKASL